jgi:hypothetical protein
MSDQREDGDLFGGPPMAQERAPQLAFSGVLRHHAEIRLKPIDGHGLHVPVLCLDLEDVGPGHHRVHAEQPFTEQTRADAEAIAKRLRKGDHVTVVTNPTDMRLFLPAVSIQCENAEESSQ